MQKRQIAKSLACLLLTAVAALSQSPQAELKDEHDPIRRSDKALVLADAAFDRARAAYTNDDAHKGDAELDDMVSALNECVAALEANHKSRSFKKAEMRVSFLQRRLRSLMDEISLTERGWAEQTGRKLEEIHDKLLEGAMKK